MRNRYFSRSHLLIAGVVGALAAVVLLVLLAALFGRDPKPAGPSRAAVAQVTSSVTNPACNPPLGAGHMGICAPPAQRELPRLFGATRTITGHRGVDISSWQGCSNTLTNPAVEFYFFKYNESTGYRDPCAAHNAATARARRHPYGAYDFLRPGRTSAAAEADTFIGVARRVGIGRLGAVADVEANAGLGRTAYHNYVCTWVGRVQHALHVPVRIYTAGWAWNPWSYGNCGAELWVAAYGNGFAYPSGWGAANTRLWQYSDGRVGPYPRLNGWDSDVFLGSEAQWRAFAAGPRPAPRPLPARYDADCKTLVGFRARRARGEHPTPAFASRAARARRRLMAHKLHCTAAGKAARK